MLTNILKAGDDQDAVIRNFLKERDFPGWFRGLSLFQIKAADELLNSIRDDSQQGTTHRVRDVLITLGIEPAVSGAKIKVAMRLSRGNDLAFLWFLMELYYRHTCDDCEHDKPDGYTINEQLILSAIAHLDTVATLIELDKILPVQPPRKPKKKTIKIKRTRQATKLPYFQIQHRPVEYSTRLTAVEKDLQVNLTQYTKCINSNYVVPNFANRWFENYQLGTAEMVTFGMVNERINKVFDQPKEDRFSARQEKLPSLCSRCATMKAIKKSLAFDRKEAKRRACEKHFDLEAHTKNKTLRSFAKVLDQEKQAAKERWEHLGAGECTKSFPYNEKSQPEGNPDLYDALFMYDKGHSSVAPLKKCEYFNAPTGNKPYQFNYDKIFDLGCKNPVKEAVANALNNGSSSDEVSLDHSRAVSKCCNDIWATEVQKFRKEYVQKKKQDEALNKAKSNDKIEPTYYNPRNKELMDKMLRSAIDQIKKNKKFVLAQFPNAHKVPILKQWIKNRYGMVYSKHERLSSYKLSRHVFRALKKQGINAKLPEPFDVSINRDVSYGCKKYLVAKTNYLQDKYHHNFKVGLLEATRVFWYAIRPFHCSKGAPRNTFFAYLPARQYDVAMFRPWQPNEFIPAKVHWDRRQKIKNMDVLY